MKKNMQEFFNIILALLGKHSCVIVPGLGGFVVSKKNATIRIDGVSFMPPMKEVMFNQLLTHNDGLLAQEYMSRYGKTFQEANELIATIVSQIQQELAVTHTLKVSDWGQFTVENKNLKFVQIRSVVEDEDSFGLREFYFPLLSDDYKEKNSLSDKEITSNGHGFMKPFLVGTAAAIAMLMVFHVQTLQQESEVNCASFQPSTLLVANLQSQVREKSDTIHALKSALNTYQQASVGFYLVLADFESLDDARAYVETKQLQGIDSLQLLTLDDKFFVSVASSQTKDELLNKKNELIGSSIQCTDSYILSVTKMND